jgi:hypothetical protein
MAEPTHVVTGRVSNVLLVQLTAQATVLVGLLDSIISTPLVARALAAETWSSQDTADLKAICLRAVHCAQRAADQAMPDPV